MPKAPNQRQRIMALYRMLYENTDSRHGLTMSEILDRLAELEIPSDRRAIYDDIRSLNETFAENPRDKNQFAIQIETTRTNPIRYYLKAREFEIDELKLLVDSVRTYPFITKGQTKKLVRKLEHLCAKPQLRELRGRQYVIDYQKSSLIQSGKTVKTEKLDNQGVPNRKLSDGYVFEKMDFINEAIAENKCISFRYVQYATSNKRNEDNTIRIRHKSTRADWVSPYALLYADGDYYLVAVLYSEKAEEQSLVRYRVDRMKEIEIRRIDRKGQALFEELAQRGSDLAKQFFSVEEGKSQTVELVCQNHLLNAVIERFGEDTKVYQTDKEHFKAILHVVVNESFLGWLLGLGAGARVTSPFGLTQHIKEYLRKIQRNYR